MVERRTVDAVVAGSSPVIRPKKPQLKAGAFRYLPTNAISRNQIVKVQAN